MPNRNMKTKGLSVSVIIPTFNREDRLPAAIRSVLTQSLAPSEIIVVDDGSTDATENIVKSFTDVQYIHQENKGVSQARNYGISLARYEWIAFLDSDDEWLPHKLERQWQALEHQPQYRLCHTNEIWIRNGIQVNPMKKHAKHGGFIFSQCLPLCVISPSSVLMHRDLFELYGTFDSRLPVCEDYDLWLRICAKDPVLYVDEPLLLKFGGHEDQLSRAYWGMDRFRIQALENLILHCGLDEDSLAAAVAILYQKIDIYANGALKRRKLDEAHFYREKKRHYQECFGSV